MSNKYGDEIIKIMNGEVGYITSDHPLIGNVEFLIELEQAYSDAEHYEVASLIKDRIVIVKANDIIKKSLDDLNNKIRSYKKKK